MTHQVPGYYRSVSEHLSNILDNIGYSWEDRDRKVRVANEAEVFENMAIALEAVKCRWYMFGSRGEGSTGPGLQSDMDYVYHACWHKVVTDLTECQPDMLNFLMVEDNLIHPGYVQLQIIGIPPYYPQIPVYDMECDRVHRLVLANTIFQYPGLMSGPAFQFTAELKEYSIDSVFAYGCSQWPQQGYEWFLRRRFNGWPKPIQIENAWEYGCFVTPVGHPHSPQCHLEWRLSFSIAERELTRSFEDTAMKVYILLKMIKKTHIEPHVGDAFSSYHCKVCMLWMRETTPAELWSNTNLLYCLILCIKQLYEWAKKGICPDYFIKTNNIYDRKIVGKVQDNLVKILRDLLSADCTFLLQITCCNLGQHLVNGISIFDDFTTSSMYSIVSEEEVNYKLTYGHACTCRYSVLKYIPQHYPTLIDYLDTIMYASNRLPCIMQSPLKHIMEILWSQLGFHIVTVCRENACILSREQVDYLETLASGCLSLGINSDATSVRLKLCGLGMELGNHDLVETCLQHISNFRMRYMYSGTVDRKLLLTALDYSFEANSARLLMKRYSTDELLQTQVSFSVVYLPSEILITPKPLRMEMFRSIGEPSKMGGRQIPSWFSYGVVGLPMCLYFFQYLNFRRKGKEGHKRVAMDKMIDTIGTDPNIQHKETGLNLLGYMFMEENQLEDAFRCFTQSLTIIPHYNAAKFYLAILFKRIYATHRRQTRYGRRTSDTVS